MSRWLVLALLAGCTLEQPLPPEEEAPGDLAILDTGGEHGDTGWWPSLTIDAHDQAHLSYCDPTKGDLRYAVRIGDAWRPEVAIGQGSVGKYTAIAVNSSGQPAISFYDQDHQALRYAWPDRQGHWLDERVAGGLEVGVGAELRFDEHDGPHIFYYAPSGRVMHSTRAREAGTPWAHSVVAPARGGYSAHLSVSQKPEGFWLAFVDWNNKDTNLGLARPTQEGYVIERPVLERSAGWRTGLSVTHGIPELLYTLSLERELRVARPESGSWTSTLVARNIGNLAATETRDGELVVAYENARFLREVMGGVRLMRRKAGQTRRFIIDPVAPAGDYLAVAVDSRGRAVVAYHSSAVHGLKIYDESIPARR